MGACCSSPTVENGSTHNVQPKKSQSSLHDNQQVNSHEHPQNTSGHHSSHHNNNAYPVQSTNDQQNQNNNGQGALPNNAQNIPWQQRYEFAAGILGK